MGSLLTPGTGLSVVEPAQGCWINDAGGNRYLDGLGVSGRHSLRAPIRRPGHHRPAAARHPGEITTLAVRVAAALEEMR
ncbi:MAG TPA: hypothetical protein VMS99_18750 [Acidimicrobiia bacterium]|nr:hypothetical protein [Acidimicrobiia bacterium]